MKSSIHIASSMIPDEIMQKIESLPDARTGGREKEFTPWQDTVLLKYWNQKKQHDISKIVGHCVQSCRSRYQELKKTDQK